MASALAVFDLGLDPVTGEHRIEQCWFTRGAGRSDRRLPRWAGRLACDKGILPTVNGVECKVVEYAGPTYYIRTSPLVG